MTMADTARNASEVSSTRGSIASRALPRGARSSHDAAALRVVTSDAHARTSPCSRRRGVGGLVLGDQDAARRRRRSRRHRARSGTQSRSPGSRSCSGAPVGFPASPARTRDESSRRGSSSSSATTSSSTSGERTTSGIAALVVALSPGITLVLALALGLDRVRLRHVLGLAVAFVGVAVVIALGTGRGSRSRAPRPAHRPRRAALVRALQRHPEAAARTLRPAGTDRRDEPRRQLGLLPFVRASTVNTVADGSARGRALAPVPGSPRDVPRVHPLERRPPRPRADPGGDLHVCDLSAGVSSSARSPSTRR